MRHPSRHPPRSGLLRVTAQVPRTAGAWVTPACARSVFSSHDSTPPPFATGPHELPRALDGSIDASLDG